MNTPSYTLNEAMEIAMLAAHSRSVVCLEGSPGIGKSSIVEMIAGALELPLYVINLPNHECTDLTGLPWYDRDTHQTRFAPPAMLPTRPAVVFLDEITAADTATKKAAQRLILERRIGDYRLPEGSVLICAGNLAAHRSGATAVNMALDNRMIHVPIRASFADFEAWALDAPVRPHTLRPVDPYLDLSTGESTRLLPLQALAHRSHPTVLAYTRRRPSHLDSFAEARDRGESAYATPRSWGTVSRLLQAHDELGTDASLPMLEAAIHCTVGHAIGAEFVTYMREAMTMPDPSVVDKDPMHAPIPGEGDLANVGTAFAFITLLAATLTPDNVDNRIEWLARCPGEFIVCMNADCVRRHPWYAQSQAYVRLSATLCALTFVR